jgi:DNA phosphorothioation-associated putative methyltransferase
MRTSAIVNIGYVVNVIEDPIERREALERAWSITEKVLIVSGRLTFEAQFEGGSRSFSDGHLTVRNTFQKFFEQDELRSWIDQTLGAMSVAAAPGIFYVFRDEQSRTDFVSSRYRRRILPPRTDRTLELFKAHEEMLRPLADFMYANGRLPSEDEIADPAPIRTAFGTLKRAVQIVARTLDAAHLALVASLRREDILIYLALARFSRRPKLKDLPGALREDIRSFFRGYAKACDHADGLLQSLGKTEDVDKALRSSEIGKKTPSALYVHTSAVERLSPLARLYEGCARAYLGNPSEANIVKLHLGQPKVSYLSYPTFREDAHPTLATSTSVDLRTFRVKYRDYRSQANLPILHRKELFVAPDFPEREKFARLTRSEELKGLYEQTDRIGMSQGWANALTARRLRISGHRLLSARGD